MSASMESNTSAESNTAASAVSLEAGRDGLTRLERHWAAPTPRAAMVLVHGIGEHSGRYEHVGQRLAAAGIDVLGFDNRGFGQSGGKRAHLDSFDQFLDDVEDLLARQRRLDVPVILMGHSLGGLIASTYLVSDRPQPDLAILSAPALEAIVPGWQRKLAPVLSKIAPSLFIKSKIDAELLSRDVAVQQAYLDDPLVFGGATARFGNEVFTTMATTSASLDRITIPLYVLHGDADRLVPLSASDGLAALGTAERRVWPGLRHECLNEPEHDQVLDELIAWVDAQLATS
ncbi:MAG: alpha/beta hydrolase [Acidimicrobiales bacterium]